MHRCWRLLAIGYSHSETIKKMNGGRLLNYVKEHRHVHHINNSTRAETCVSFHLDNMSCWRNGADLDESKNKTLDKLHKVIIFGHLTEWMAGFVGSVLTRLSSTVSLSVRGIKWEEERERLTTDAHQPSDCLIDLLEKPIPDEHLKKVSSELN